MLTASYIVPGDPPGFWRPREEGLVNDGTPHIVFTTQTEVLAETPEEEAFLDAIGDSLSLGNIVSGDMADAVASALRLASR